MKPTTSSTLLGCCLIVDEPYPDGRAVLSAIKDKARAAHRAGQGHSVQSLVDLAVFDRFLCRVFSANAGRFALKGGTGLLARLPDARNTTDVDLETADIHIDDAIRHLTDLATIDLGDHLNFRYTKHRITGGTAQPQLNAARITFSVTVRGTGTLAPISVDLAIHPRSLITPPQLILPAFRLGLPRLGPVIAYRAIAIEDQIADKVCATQSLYGGQQSTRSKDLVDLAIICTTLSFDARRIRMSIQSESRNRGLADFTTITVPQAMIDGYLALARTTRLLGDVLDPAKAISAVNAMLEPALSGAIDGGTWNPVRQQWAEDFWLKLSSDRGPEGSRCAHP